MFKILVQFSVAYQTQPGEVLFVVGDHPILGNWDPLRGLRLDWTEGHKWMKRTQFLQGKQDCEYKYVVCHEESGRIKVLRWEEGPNRCISFCQNKSLKIFLNDVWEHRKIKLRIPSTLDPNSIMLLLLKPSNSEEWKSPRTMDLILKRDQYHWQKEFLIDSKSTSIKYHYLSLNKNTKKLLWERCNSRSISLNSLFKNKTFTKISKKSYKINFKNNILKVTDKEFNREFEINEIDEHIIVGPFPQTFEEIDALREKGVKAVLNLQREIDMKVRKIRWNEIRNHYEENNMEIVNFEINDNNQDDLTEKISYAAEILHELINKYDKVYVHCTAGVIRAPHTVIAYLCLFKGLPLDKAMSLIKMKRPKANLNKRCLENALSFKEIKHYISFI